MRLVWIQSMRSDCLSAMHTREGSADRGRSTKPMRTITASFGAFLTALVVASCSDNDATERPSRPANPPAYEVKGTSDISFGGIRRLEARVSLPEHYARNEVRKVAEAVVADITKAEPVNAISIFFYGPGTATDGSYDVASVEWAPNGEWRNADSVEAGQYASFGYSVSYIAPAPPPAPDAKRLAVSGRTGLLGAPLPEGARLIDESAADPSAGRDATEQYEIAATSAEIIEFFKEAMPDDGWVQDGPTRKDAVFFSKRGRSIVVISDKDEGTFTLMGS